MNNTIKILIFIPIFNPPEYLYKKTIPALAMQSVINEVHLVSSSGFVSSGSYRTTVINQKDFNHANTRNMVLDSDADFYLFMTQDAIPVDNSLVEELLNSMKDPKVVVSYARQVPFEDASPSEKFARNENYPAMSYVKSIQDLPKLGIKTFFSSNSCAMYRGDIFRKSRGFLPDLNTSEDMYYAAKALKEGYKVTYCAEAQVWHSHNYTLKSLYYRYHQIGLFFKNNKWIEEMVKEHTQIEKTGIMQIIKELLYLWKYAPLHIPRACLEAFIKYIAYKKASLF